MEYLITCDYNISSFIYFFVESEKKGHEMNKYFRRHTYKKYNKHHFYPSSRETFMADKMKR